MKTQKTQKTEEKQSNAEAPQTASEKNKQEKERTERKLQQIVVVLLLLIAIACKKEEPATITLPYTRECETADAKNTGQVIYRSAASGSKVMGQFSCQNAEPWSAIPNGYVRFTELNFPKTDEELMIELRYSKYSAAKSWIYLKIDGVVRDSIMPLNLGSWNIFSQDTFNIGHLVGHHSLEFFVSESQTYGTADLDMFTIKRIQED